MLLQEAISENNDYASHISGHGAITNSGVVQTFGIAFELEINCQRRLI